MNVSISLESIFKNRKEICDQIATTDDYNLITSLVKLIFLSGGLYGFSMGLYNSWAQAGASAVKVPVLFFVTLLICLPTLHFSALILGSKIRFLQSVSILLWGIAINCVLLGAFAPISFFFWLSGSSYKFLMIMHLTFFTLSGLAGLLYITANFSHMIELKGREYSLPGKRQGILLKIWLFLYMFIGTQMAYVLSPFIGKKPGFIPFVHDDYNFYSFLFHLFFK